MFISLLFINYISYIDNICMLHVIIDEYIHTDNSNTKNIKYQ